MLEDCRAPHCVPSALDFILILKRIVNSDEDFFPSEDSPSQWSFVIAKGRCDFLLLPEGLVLLTLGVEEDFWARVE